MLLVQPPAWIRGDTAFDARPLAALLAEALGQPVRARVSDDALSHWQAVRATPDYQLAFDEAHFADYRIRRHGFTALVRDVADARFAVLVRPRTVVTGPSDLAGRRVAAPPPPSLASVRLMGLFPELARTPRLVVMASRADALDALARGEVAAALVEMDDGRPVAGAQTALVTDVSPGRALTVSAALAERAGRVLASTLVAARDTPRGRRALAALGVRALVPASDTTYEDSERLLRGTWGYR